MLRSARNDEEERACVKLSSRAPDAAQRPGDALQSRGPCFRERNLWFLGPGSAPQRFARCDLSGTWEGVANERRGHRLSCARLVAEEELGAVCVPQNLKLWIVIFLRVLQ
ncbi:hypothetical protein TM239_33690 [Bradyrhizobium sp. TM239]|nr:hypothetical protein TM233_40250 [Bradyrhizobium sp. TM233]GMP03038.1 hypothetical protein TM239_33690 [Bradyrhizobium sp. TM239]